MAMMLIAVARANMAWIVDVGKKKRRKKAIVASPRGLDRWLGWESSGRNAKDALLGIRLVDSSLSISKAKLLHPTGRHILLLPAGETRPFSSRVHSFHFAQRVHKSQSSAPNSRSSRLRLLELLDPCLSERYKY
ncbi:hypothetical protein E4T52_10994 [Aureobasidium sp. EXF-3400]|nr:hypothetical protein E4T51_09875 [Aureobasidium sp. EXF-12344]KAI4774062.1 hypothetical protein E4T52_10994 [Aureobasidium sp. EXF-3400]